MKVLNFEDSVYKANAIRKVLNQCGVAKIELVSNVEDGLQMLKNAEDAGAPFDLIITDMHYPMKQGAVSDTEAGEKLVQLLQEQGKQTKASAHTRFLLLPYIPCHLPASKTGEPTFHQYPWTSNAICW